MTESDPMKREVRLVLWLTCICVALKLLFLFFFITDIRTWEDHEIAVNILNSGTAFISDSSVPNYTYQFPVHPFLLSLIYQVCGVNPFAAVVFYIFLNGVSALVLYLFFKKSLKQFPGIRFKQLQQILFISILLFEIHPGINYYLLFNIHPFTLDLFLLSISMLALQIFAAKNTLRNLILFSVTLGLAILDRVTFAVICVPFLFVLVKNHSAGKVIAKVFLSLVILSAIIGPWMIRNYMKDGIIGLTSGSGTFLWRGAQANSEGSNYLADGKICFDALTNEEINRVIKMSAKEKQDFYFQKYITLLKETPGKVFRMYLIKLKNFWLFRSHFGSELPRVLKKFILPYLFSYLFVLVMVIVSIFLLRSKSFFLMSVPVLLSLAQSVFYVETRHRLVIEPVLIFLASTGCFILMNKFLFQFIRKKKSSSRV